MNEGACFPRGARFTGGIFSRGRGGVGSILLITYFFLGLERSVVDGKKQ